MLLRTGIAILALFLLSPEAFGHAESLLQGQVFENHGETRKLAAGAQVWIVNVGNPYLTRSDGGYRLLVPDAYRIGQTIVLYVKRKGWEIATPVGGKVVLSKELTTDILLSPDGSSEFLSLEQLSKLLASLPEQLKGQVKPDGSAGTPDPGLVVKEYAIKHGLSEEEVHSKVAELVKQYEQSRDLGKQCLAAMYHKNMEQAGVRCQQNAINKVDLLKKKRQDVEVLSKGQLRSHRPVEPSLAYGSAEVLRVIAPGKQLLAESESRWNRDVLTAESPSGKSTPIQLEEARRQLMKLTEEVAGEFKSSGDTYYADYQFDNALQAYTDGLSYVEKKDLPTIWADMQWVIGMANWQIGIRTKGTAVREHLTDAAKRYREAQTVYTKTEFPEAYSALQNNLGIVLQEQGIRTSGEAGMQLLAQAVVAYRAALTVYTKDALPQTWATTQNNLGTVLQDQGTRTSGEAGTQLLAQAVVAYRDALTVRTKDALPQDWAMTQNNLGTVLGEQGIRTSGEAGTQLLAQAVVAFREALTIYTKETLPQDWAGTQNNLGIVLQEQGIRTSGEEGRRLLRQAIEAFQLALQIITKDALSVEWNPTVNNLKKAEQALADKK